MAYQDIPEKQEFSKEVYKIEPEDLVHADLMNEIISQLLTNEVFLKSLAEKHIKGDENLAGSKHIPSGGSAGQVLKYGGSSGTASWGSDSYYGTCQTAAEAAAKTVPLSGFSLFTGATIAVMFSNGNTAANPTLNVNSTGAKAIYYRNAALTASTASIIAKNGVYLFVYSGSYWRLVGDVGSIALSEVADKLSTPRTIDGVDFDGSADITHFGVCETAGDVAEKVVSIPGFVLKDGAKVSVFFKNGNSSSYPSLNINGTGKFSINKRAGTNSNSPVNADAIGFGAYEFIYFEKAWYVIEATIDNYIKFNSDDLNDTDYFSWESVNKLISGERLREILNKISKMFKNVRYLHKLLGKTDISAIGDGTVTGILNGMQNKSVNITTSYTASKKINCIYNSTSCILKLLNIEDVPASTTIKIATLPEELRPGFEIIQDNVSPAGGHIRIYVKPDGTVNAYRYNNLDIYNLGITITYLL